MYRKTCCKCDKAVQLTFLAERPNMLHHTVSNELSIPYKGFWRLDAIYCICMKHDGGLARFIFPISQRLLCAAQSYEVHQCVRFSSSVRGKVQLQPLVLLNCLKWAEVKNGRRWVAHSASQPGTSQSAGKLPECSISVFFFFLLAY